MSRKGKTLVLLAVLAVLLAVGWIAIRELGKREEEEPPSSGGEIILSEDGDLLLTLSIGSGEETVRFSRDNGDLVWMISGYPGAEADDDKISRILDALSPLTAIRRLDSAPEDSGLGEEALRFAFGTENGEKILWIGKENKALEGVYLRIEGREGVFLVPRELSDAVSHPARYFLKPDVIPRLLSPDGFRVNGLSLVYREDGEERIWAQGFHWFFEGSGDRYAGTEEVDALLNAVRKSAFLEVAGRKDDPQLALRTGLSEPEAVFSADWTEDGERKTFTLLIGKSFRGEEGEKLCYAAAEGSDYVCILDESVKEALLTASEKSLFPHAALPVDWDAVDGVKVMYGGKERVVTFSRETAEDESGEKREILVFREGGRALDREACEAFFEALTALTAEGEAESGAAGETPAFSLTLLLKSGDTPEMTFELLPYDPLFLRVRFDGRDFLLVGKSEAERLSAMLEDIFGPA